MINGIVLIDKRKYISSNEILSIFKKKVPTKKAGLLGILDPLATGLLPVVIGEATKYTPYIQDNKKTYDVKCKLGVFSECGDYELEPIIFDDEKDIIESLTVERIKNTFKNFLGNYSQIPPMFSATKYKGKPLYSYARENITIEREPKNRFIYNLKLISLNNDLLNLRVTCSSGTYIRTLIQDISRDWNLHSCLVDLNRTHVDPFNNYLPIDIDLINESNIYEYIIPIEDMLQDYPNMQCDHEEIQRLYNGLCIKRESESRNYLCKLIDEKNIFHGMGYFQKGILYPKRLMKR